MNNRFLFLIPLLLFLAPHAPARAQQPLRLVQTIPLTGVEGRIDHMAVDLKHNRLFVSALGNGTVEVIDLKAGKDVKSLSGFHEPQGTGYAPGTNSLIVANGESGECDFFDAASFKPLGKLHLGDDADDIRMDPANHLAVVGYGEGGLALIDMKKLKLVENTTFQGHPEAFALAGNLVYVNIPSQDKIAVIDPRRQTVIQSWPMIDAHANFPMALDQADHRLFVGCRNPARLLVYDTTTGKVVANLPIGGDTDDLYYDRARKQIYVSCGAGQIDVISQADRDHYKTVATIPTASGARTSLFVPELHRLYVAVPHRGSQPAEMLVFATEP